MLQSLCALQNHCKVAFRLQQTEGKGGCRCMSARMVQASVSVKPGDSPLRILCMDDGHLGAFYSLGGHDQ